MEEHSVHCADSGSSRPGGMRSVFSWPAPQRKRAVVPPSNGSAGPWSWAPKQLVHSLALHTGHVTHGGAAPSKPITIGPPFSQT